MGRHLHTSIIRRSQVARQCRRSRTRGRPDGGYQIDGIDPSDATGWSVLVKGRATELRDVDELRSVSSLPLNYWTLGDKAHWVRIVPDEVTGRRIWCRTTAEAGITAAEPASATADPSDERDQEVNHGDPADGS